MRTKVPLKIAQRHTTSRINGVALQDLRIYGRNLSEVEVEQLASSSRLASILAKPAAKRSKAESDELFDFWLRREDKPYQDLTARLAETEKEQLAIRARGTVAHVMQERAEPPKAYVLFRGDYDKRREEVKPATPRSFRPCRPTCRGTASVSPNGCCGRSIR